MTNAGGTVSYSYSALELRMGKTGPTALVPTGAAYYVYDEEGKLLGEYDANGVPQYETIYLGSPVGVIKQTGTAAGSDIAISLYNVSTDQLGAPRVITRQSDEAIVWRWDTAEPFGATAPDQNPSSLGVFAFNQRLPGQTFDAESGLFQNWHREYNPRIGRYMQSDPIGLGGGINTFSYVNGDPIQYIDPNGQFGVVTRAAAAVAAAICKRYPCAPAAAAAAVAAAKAATETADAICRATSRIKDWMRSENNGDTKPPPDTIPIDETKWSGNHTDIKGQSGAGAADNVRIGANGDVWVQQPDGSWLNAGNASDMIGGNEAAGRRGKDREPPWKQDRGRKQRGD